MPTNKKKKIFIVHKKAKWGLYYSEDVEIIKFLSEFYEVEIIDWQKTNPKDIPKNSIIFFRCPNDWIKYKSKFITWLSEIKKSRFLINDFLSIKKGIDKNYLENFSKNNINIIPSIFVNKPIFKVKIPWNNCVIKPIVGESGLGVKRVIKKQLNCNYLLNYYHKYGDFIIQKYQKEIKTRGGLSVVFINKKYMYTVSTNPLKKSFITDWSTAQQVQDNKILIKKSKECIKLWGKKCDYVRIDWLYSENDFYLLEFEVVDPMFFYKCLDQETKQTFLNELLKVIKKYEV